jgi:hypothetical protein
MLRYCCAKSRTCRDRSPVGDRPSRPDHRGRSCDPRSRAEGCHWVNRYWRGGAALARRRSDDVREMSVKTVGTAYVGSNPTPATTQNPRSELVSESLRPRKRERCFKPSLNGGFCRIRWSASRAGVPGMADKRCVRRIGGEVSGSGMAQSRHRQAEKVRRHFHPSPRRLPGSPACLLPAGPEAGWAVRRLWGAGAVRLPESAGSSGCPVVLGRFGVLGLLCGGGGLPVEVAVGEGAACGQGDGGDG